MTLEGFLFTFLSFVILICIIVVITVASTVSSTVAAIVDDEDEEEQQILYYNFIDKGYEKEEYITRLPREKHSLAERCFEVRLMEGSF